MCKSCLIIKISHFLYLYLYIYSLFYFSTAADSQESGSPPLSPTDSAASESAPTLVHIKQETMAPGTDMKEYYNALDFGISDPYLLSSYDYERNYLSRPLELPNQRFLDSKSPERNDDDCKDDLDKIDFNVPSDLILKSGGVYARASIPIGTKYGPFNGKWETQPLDRRYAWEVSFNIFTYFLNIS